MSRANGNAAAAGRHALAGSRASAARSRTALALFFVGAGVNHFVSPRFYLAIVPPPLRRHAKLVVDVSGVAEVLGGLAVLPARTRRAGGAWLVALLASVFPANVHMALAPERFPKIPRWALFARLPLQPLMMWWAWRATRD